MLLLALFPAGGLIHITRHNCICFAFLRLTAGIDLYKKQGCGLYAEL